MNNSPTQVLPTTTDHGEVEATALTVHIEFIGLISNAVEQTVRNELDQLLPLMGKNSLQTGDFLTAGRHKFRVASRHWYSNRFERSLVIRLSLEAPPKNQLGVRASEASAAVA